MKNISKAATTVAAIALSSALLVGCTGDDRSEPRTAEAGADDLQQSQLESGVPEACLEAFPVAMTAPELAAITLLPADWPEAPAGATLCQTSSTMDSGVQIADYATNDPTADVLDGYEDALSAYDVVRADEGLGDQLSGTAGSVSFEINTRDGAYSVTFAPAG